ncbi:DNA polymerase III epsilon subunit-like protein [Kineosphaera limosa]|nr:exonuclease domain-containing protein [Kineosphaera limosa]NYE00245.1 DNA polymerase III epsilon subunit-like protein [Kineosphaera limosa]
MAELVAVLVAALVVLLVARLIGRRQPTRRAPRVPAHAVPRLRAAAESVAAGRPGTALTVRAKAGLPKVVDTPEAARATPRRDHPAGGPATDRSGPGDHRAARDAGPGDEPADGPAGAPAAPAPKPPAPGKGRAALFAYGTRRPGGHRVPGPYVAVAVRTNGLTPMRDRIIEIAALPLDSTAQPDGKPLVSLLEPPNAEVGPTFLHGLEPADVRFAPSFADLARQVLAPLEGRVVVAHNAGLVEQFLAAEFLVAGLLVPTHPALDISAMAREVIATPNYRLPTLAAHLRQRYRRGGAAIDEAKLVAALLPTLLARCGDSLTYPVPATPVHDLARGAARPAPRPRPVHPDTVEPWLAGLMTRVSASAHETNDPRVAAYLEGLTDVVSRGRIVTAETGELAGMLARSGYPASRIRTILERLLESLRIAAFEEARIGPAQLRHLRAVATSVGIPTYFDDLIPPKAPPAPQPGSGSFSRPVRKPLPLPAPPRAPRCGHCLVVGHWTANCPRLRGSRSDIVTPVSPIDPI